MGGQTSWWAIALSGFGVTILGWIGTLVYRHFRKEKDASSQTIIGSSIVGPVAGRDMHIGAVNITPPSSIPSVAEEEYHEHPTPQEMNKEIRKVSMLSQGKIADNYQNLKVKWRGVVYSVREISNGVIDFTMKYDGHFVDMKVKIDDYPILRTVRGEGDELVTVKGTIDYVQSNGPVHLKDVKLAFSLPSKAKPTEPTERNFGSSDAPTFNNKDHVKIKGSDSVGVIEQIRAATGGGALYCVEFNSDFSTRVWVKESDLERV